MKGDRIYLTPHNENQQTFSGTRTNFMGKQITYQGITTAKEYPFRIRATVDNPRDPYSPGVFGTDWVCDEPHAIVEEGSNSNGSYVIFANNEVAAESNILVYIQDNPGWSYQNWFFPIHIITPPKVLGHFGITFRGVGGGDGVCAVVQGCSNVNCSFSSRNFLDTAHRNIETGRGFLRAKI